MNAFTIERVCPECGRTFKMKDCPAQRNRIYCDKKCEAKAAHKSIAEASDTSPKAETPILKKCSNCGEYLPLTAFTHQPGKRLGTHGYCKKCMREYKKAGIKKGIKACNPTDVHVTEWVKTYLEKCSDRNNFSRDGIVFQFKEEHPDFIHNLIQQGFKDPEVQLKRYIVNYLKTRPDLTYPKFDGKKAPYVRFYRIPQGVEA